MNLVQSWMIWFIITAALWALSIFFEEMAEEDEEAL
jgi:hypothetical protein